MAGTSDLKSKRPSSFKQVTSRDAVELQNALDCSNLDVGKILHWIRTKYGRKAVVANSGKEAVESGKELDRFYEVGRSAWLAQIIYRG